MGITAHGRSCGLLIRSLLIQGVTEQSCYTVTPGDPELSLDYALVFNEQPELSTITQYETSLIFDPSDPEFTEQKALLWWNPGCSYHLLYANKSIISPVAVDPLGWASDEDEGIWETGQVNVEGPHLAVV